jgi:hypothetical protein
MYLSNNGLETELMVSDIFARWEASIRMNPKTRKNLHAG